MCLILFAWDNHPDFKLLVAANRDEFYERPAAAAAFWDDHPEVLAGKDLKAGGTWMGITRSGRFAAVTNYRDPANIKKGAPSRGQLTTDYLAGTMTAMDYLEDLLERCHLYNGFNLLIGDGTDLYYLSNYENRIRTLNPGVYGLSNGLLDDPWPKVKNGKKMISQMLQGNYLHPDNFFKVLSNKDTAPDDQLPSTGVPLSWERALSAMHIVTNNYGTVSSSAVMVTHSKNIIFAERVHGTVYRNASDKLFELSYQIDPIKD